jgi:hypothetical protein
VGGNRFDPTRVGAGRGSDNMIVQEDNQRLTGGDPGTGDRIRNG